MNVHAVRTGLGIEADLNRRNIIVACFAKLILTGEEGDRSPED